MGHYYNRLREDGPVCHHSLLKDFNKWEFFSERVIHGSKK